MSSPSTSHQLVVRDDDQRVDVLAELLDAGLRDRLPLALERERPRHDRDGQDAELFAISAMTGAAPVPVPPPMPAVMNSMSAPSISSAMRSRSSIAASRPISGLRAGAEAARERRAELQLRARGRALERLRVGVRADELDAGKPVRDHVLDRVAAAAADADDLDDRAVLRGLVDDLEHGVLLPFWS